MGNTPNKFAISRNLGFITGPLLIAIGIFGYNRHVNDPLSIVMIILGIFRLGITIYSLQMSKKNNQDN
jgi:uncharacterized membrane protein